MKSLMDRVHEDHVITETESGPYCWSCTQATGTDTPHPCATLARAEELEAVTPLEPVEPEPAEPAKEPQPAKSKTTEA